jgi:hypothetical protein
LVAWHAVAPRAFKQRERLLTLAGTGGAEDGSRSQIDGRVHGCPRERVAVCVLLAWHK